MNRKKLEELLVPKQQIKAFMSNAAFPLSVQTAFVEDLTRLGSVPGVLQAVPVAITADSEEQARFLTDVLGALAKYNQNQTPLARIIVTGTIIGRDRTGALNVPAELDYVGVDQADGVFC
jgi:hypothetical protein